MDIEVLCGLKVVEEEDEDSDDNDDLVKKTRIVPTSDVINDNVAKLKSIAVLFGDMMGEMPNLGRAVNDLAKQVRSEFRNQQREKEKENDSRHKRQHPISAFMVTPALVIPKSPKSITSTNPCSTSAPVDTESTESTITPGLDSVALPKSITSTKPCSISAPVDTESTKSTIAPGLESPTSPKPITSTNPCSISAPVGAESTESTITYKASSLVIDELGSLGINILCCPDRSCVIIIHLLQGGIGSAINLQFGDQVYFKDPEDPMMEVYNNFVSRVKNRPFTLKVRRGSEVPHWIQEKIFFVNKAKRANNNAATNIKRENDNNNTATDIHKK